MTHELHADEEWLATGAHTVQLDDLVMAQLAHEIGLVERSLTITVVVFECLDGDLVLVAPQGLVHFAIVAKTFSIRGI